MGGAFIAGAAAIFSPGLALLVPGYAAFIAACSRDAAAGRQSLLFAAAGFIAAFALVFVAFSASATALSAFLIEYLLLLTSIAGIVLLLAGLSSMRAARTGGRWVALFGAVIGIAFAVGWKPTVDATLAAILIAVARPDSLGKGVALLSSYALGLAVPLLIIAVATNLAVARWRRFDRAIAIVSGTLIVVTGVLIFTNR